MAAINKFDGLVIGLDCSTTSTKAVVADSAGRIEALSKSPIPVSSPQPGYFEQDPDEWWRAAVKVLSKVTRQVYPERIKALAISNQRETFVALDEKGKPLRNAIIWLDERCKDDVKPFAEKIGVNRIHRITGKPVDFAPVVYRLAWMKKHEPALYKRIAKVCDVHSYIVWKLTGAFSTSQASADPTGIYDIKKMEWSSLILNKLNLSVDQLPEVVRPGRVLSHVSEKASGVSGLKAGTPVAAGGGDGQAAGTGANAFSSGRAYLNLGTAAVAGVYGKHYKTSKAFRTMIACAENGYIYESSLRTGTFALDWFIRNILSIDTASQKGIYKILRREAERVTAGSGGLLFLPYLNGVMNPYWDINARGAFVGLSSSHTRAHMYRAILEGIAYEKLFALRAIEKNTGVKISELAAIGGGAANRLWCAVFADITGMNICLPEESEASGLGAAVTASVAAGWYKNIKSAAKNMTGTKEVIKPNLDNHKIYKRFYTAYSKIYKSTLPVNSLLAG